MKAPQTKALDGQVPADKRIGLNERLGLISLIDEGARQGSSNSPAVTELFSNLWELVNATVRGSRIDRLKPEESRNGFRVMEINSAAGDTLGRLNMLYLRKPVPCYYLVYVEVSAPYRRKGLGNRILEHFREFLTLKSAIGILDNIIPEHDPTYGIYLKQAWEPVDFVLGDAVPDMCENYMIFIPPRLQGKDLKEPVLKLLHHLRRKRAAIDMRDNEIMVQRTISEFRDLYHALLIYFDQEIRTGQTPPLMRYMFTRFVTKLIAFRRRIADLLGYTGGDSMEQIVLAPEISSMPAQSYAPVELRSRPLFVTGDKGLWMRIPDELKNHPARVIEALPNYRRPSFQSWMNKRPGADAAPTLTIGDLMDLGFDPTRLKELDIQGEPYIFERIQARQLTDLEKKTRLLKEIASSMEGLRSRNAQIKTNPPLLVIQDRGNAYVLRKKIDGIHWEEAVEQLQGSPRLKAVNEALKIDGLILRTLRHAERMIEERLTPDKTSLDMLARFVSWDLDANRPRLVVDIEGAFLESIWLA